MEDKFEMIDTICARLRKSYLAGMEMSDADRLDSDILNGLIMETGVTKGYINRKIFGDAEQWFAADSKGRGANVVV